MELPAFRRLWQRFEFRRPLPPTCCLPCLSRPRSICDSTAQSPRFMMSSSGPRVPQECQCGRSCTLDSRTSPNIFPTLSAALRTTLRWDSFRSAMQPKRETSLRLASNNIWPTPSLPFLRSLQLPCSDICCTANQG